MKIKKRVKASIGFLLIIAAIPASFGVEPIEDNTEQIATLRQGTILSEQSQNPPPIKNPSNKDETRERAYPMQPPSIPHTINNYQVDQRANKCLSCHSRTRVRESQAPMISVTHFMDRDGNFLADVSPRRYFCNQCHVTQIEDKPLVNNTFTSVDKLLKK